MQGKIPIPDHIRIALKADNKTKVVLAFLNRHKDDSVTLKELAGKYPHELTLQEFSLMFGKSALQLTKFKSAAAADRHLRKSYDKLIITAIHELKDNVSIETLKAVQRKSAYLKKLVRRWYCKRKGIDLSLLD